MYYSLDVYDDPAGDILKRYIPTFSDLPEYVKIACYVPGAEIPDDSFALILHDEEGGKFRKFACVDAGNTALSVLYFLETHKNLSKLAQRMAVSNLLTACATHKLNTPVGLKKLAESLGVIDSAIKQINTATGEGKNIPLPLEVSDQPKTPEDFILALTDSFPDRPQSWREIEASPPKEDPLLTNRLPSEEARPEKATKKEASRFLLPNKYPIDTYAQVEKAAEYFIQYQEDLSLKDRHTYCVKLAERCEELGVPISVEVQKYSSRDKSASFPLLATLRSDYITPEWKIVYEDMLNKMAQAPGDILAEALETFDKVAGIDHLWGSTIPDPYFTVFNNIKLAEEYTYDADDGQRVTGADLIDLATNYKHLVSKVLAATLVEEFSKEPIAAFKALPDPHKKLLARLAADRK